MTANRHIPEAQQIPEPDQHNGQPVYEGRVLPRPDDEVVDQGLGFDLVTLMKRQRNRRGLFALVTAGASVATLAACGSTSSPAAPAASASSATSAASSAAPSSATSSAAASSATQPAGSATTATTEIPDETAGPYPGDGSNGQNVLTESGVVRSDIRSSFGSSTTTAEGIPLTISLTIQDLQKSSAPWAGLAVYIWHCDREGRYSMYSPGVTDQNYLRGVQVTDSSGTVTFTSIFPACYSGRWPHIHFEVYPSEADITQASNAIATSQIALPEDACRAVYATSGYEASVNNLAGVSLSSDNVFGEDEGVHQLGAITGDVSTGYRVWLSAAVDTSTQPTGGGGPPGR